ncbi:uncharacterized protein LOC135839375 isoform X2 [Planococcus citri]
MTSHTAICAKCGEPLIPIEIHNQLLITTCRHVYHQHCVSQVLRDRDTPYQNPRIVRCSQSSCTRFLSSNDFSRIDFTYVTCEPQHEQPAHPAINQNQLDMLTGLNNQLEATIMSMAEEMKHLKIRLGKADKELENINNRYHHLMNHRINQLTSLGERNPANFVNTSIIQPQTNSASNQLNIIQMPLHHTFYFDRDNQPSSSSALSNQFKAPPLPPPWPQPRNAPPHRDNLNDNSGSKRKRESTSSEDNSNDIQQPLAPHRKKKKSKARKPPPKQIKGTPGNKGDYHTRYRKRYGTDSKELLPYYPLNSYPHSFTAAGYELEEGIYVGAWFAFNILLIGDGHIASLARFLGMGKEYDKILDQGLYRRDLLLKDLIEYLNDFTSLPPRIMLSIGNYDVHELTPYREFYNDMNKLCLILQRLKVTEIILVPLIYHPVNNQRAYACITQVLENNWGLLFGAATTRITGLFDEIHSGHCYFDDFGPYYRLEDYEEVATRIREQFIPAVLPSPSALRAAQAAAQAENDAAANPVPNDQAAANPVPNNQAAANPVPNNQAAANPVPNDQAAANPVPNNQASGEDNLHVD